MSIKNAEYRDINGPSIPAAKTSTIAGVLQNAIVSDSMVLGLLPRYKIWYRTERTFLNFDDDSNSKRPKQIYKSSKSLSQTWNCLELTWKCLEKSKIFP